MVILFLFLLIVLLCVTELPNKVEKSFFFRSLRKIDRRSERKIYDKYVVFFYQAHTFPVRKRLSISALAKNLN